jgi:hypothetical protein
MGILPMSITGILPVKEDRAKMALRLGSQTRENAFGDPLMGGTPMLLDFMFAGDGGT